MRPWRMACLVREGALPPSPVMMVREGLSNESGKGQGAFGKHVGVTPAALARFPFGPLQVLPLRQIIFFDAVLFGHLTQGLQNIAEQGLLLVPRWLNPHGPEVALKHDPSIRKRTKLACWPSIEFFAQRSQGTFKLPLIERGPLCRPNGKGLGKEALFDPHILDLDGF